MNRDFPRIITLLRKEKGISQKQAAADLGISQALLSHYEKGIRECGLDFLVKAADYYRVSCDYLLGRSAEPRGNAVGEFPKASESADNSDKFTHRQNYLLSSLKLIFSLTDKIGDNRLDKEICSYFSAAIYRIFRVVYSANPRNDRRFFTLPEKGADGFAAAAMSSAMAKAECESVVSGAQNLTVTTNMLSEDYPEYSPALLNMIKDCENEISQYSSDNMISASDK
ncbi:MAG: helix-turn-helix transcriptional regulator [Oscillospiraceae bacterium]|nr:helix-turn-helix transcriptional regulator [Oscillospiraceae bacterium]